MRSTINVIITDQLWKYLCQFSKTNVSSSDLYPFIKQAHFDGKFQPTLKKFFGLTTPKDNASASVSNTYKNEKEPNANKQKKEVEHLETNLEMEFSDSGDELLESIQLEETINNTNGVAKTKFSSEEFESTCHKNERNMPNNHDTIIEIIKIIDNTMDSTESAHYSGNTLISEFDACCKKIKTNEDVECDKVTRSETVTQVAKADGNASVGKTKITDYFVKLDKPK